MYFDTPLLLLAFEHEDVTLSWKVRLMSENIISGTQLYNKKYHQKVNHYIFVRTLQWTSSERLTNVTITVKVTYIEGEDG